MKKYLSLIKFSHTIFAMPFALIGFFLAVLDKNTPIQWNIFLLVVLCMVFARSAAMAFNRYLDKDIDEKNPRTKTREIPSGAISPNAALVFVLVNSGLFITCTAFLNPLCFLLSPVALLVILGYSYTKRFTYWCHVILGLGLALAPTGGYLAVTGEFQLIPVLLSLTVLFWVAGFDIIYALQDESFDKSQALYSIPVKFGKKQALWISVFFHIISAAALLIAVVLAQNIYPAFGWLLWTGSAIFLGMLFYQHLIVNANDLSRVNLAFFSTNGFASLVFAAFAISDIYI